MNTLRGAGRITIGGGLRPFHVGTNQTAIFCQLQGLDYDDYNRLLLEVVGNASLKQQAKTKGEAFVAKGRKELTAAEHRDFLFSSLVAGAENEGQPIDFTPRDVGNWLDEADANEAARPFLMQVKLMAERLQRLQPGNLPALPPTKKGKQGRPKKTK